MSQDGALGFAEHGWSYQAILSHYYTGTAIGKTPPRTRREGAGTGKVKRLALETYVRGVVSAEVPSELADGGAGGAGRGQPHLRDHRARGRQSQFDVYPDTARRCTWAKPRKRRAPTQLWPRRRADRHLRRAARDHLLLRRAPAATPRACSTRFPGSTAEPWLVGVADPYDSGHCTAGRMTYELRLGRRSA